MGIYKTSILVALLVFPFIAFILTLPYLIHQYRKYGSILLIKSIIFYSFILYILCAYFLVILPLPSRSYVSKLTSPTKQLELFRFIKDMINGTNFQIRNINDFFNIFKSSTVYTVIFNIFLTVPYGIYLRYFFNKKWYQVIIYSFLLSLFFELTQLSGLYGYYSRAYRLFDVDDLLINTIGGLLGFIIAPIFTRFLPTQEDLERKSYIKGTRVSIFRRIIALLIDVFALISISLIFRIILFDSSMNKYSEIISIIICYLIIPTVFPGKTFGKAVVNVRIKTEDDEISIVQTLIRNFILAFFTLYPYIWINCLNIEIEMKNRLYVVILIYEIINIGCYIFTAIKGKPRFVYEIITSTKNVSTIENIYLNIDKKFIEDKIIHNEKVIKNKKIKK